MIEFVVECVQPRGYLKNLQWVTDIDEATRFPSRYTAKRRMKQLDIEQSNVRVLELVCNNEKVNNGK